MVTCVRGNMNHVDGREHARADGLPCQKVFSLCPLYILNPLFLIVNQIHVISVYMRDQVHAGFFLSLF